MSPWIITAVPRGLGLPIICHGDPKHRSRACCAAIPCFCSEKSRNPNNYLERQSFLFAC